MRKRISSNTANSFPSSTVSASGFHSSQLQTSKCDLYCSTDSVYYNILVQCAQFLQVGRSACRRELGQLRLIGLSRVSVLKDHTLAGLVCSRSHSSQHNATAGLRNTR
eukprot:scpid41753/ scgid23117/ 